MDIQPTFDWRMRYETRENRLFSAALADDRDDLLSRIRIGFNVKWQDGLSGGFQYQFANSRLTANGVSTATTNSDVTLAFLKFTRPSGTLTLGRQRINVGTERLIGSVEWGNVGRTYDGARFEARQWELFAFRFGAALPLQPRQSFFGGLYRWQGGTTLAVHKRDKTAAGLTSIGTISHSWQGKLGPVEVDVEGAMQFGKSGSRDHLAWAWHSGVAYRPDKATRIYVEANAASGGRSANKERLFDNLVPTNHKFYGQMDLQSWRNMNELVIGVDRNFGPNLTLNVSWRRFWLRDPRDAWYAANGNPNVGVNGPLIDPTGAAGRDVGSEIDFQIIYRFHRNGTLSGGFSVFNPGSFVRTLNGGDVANQRWGYAALQFRF